MKPLEYRMTYRRKLPHIQIPGATLFVTFRLAGSLPAHIIRRLKAESERIRETLAEIADTREREAGEYRESRRQFGRWDDALTQSGYGPFWLKDERIARIVMDSLYYLNNKLYSLDAFCIMPNHVHAVFAPTEKDDGSYHALQAIMHSLKRHTARESNKILERKGRFWANEVYDHVVRDDEELVRIIRYVLYNPVKAGLVKRWQDWKWTYSGKRKNKD